MDNSTLQAEEVEALESIYGDDWQKEVDSDGSYRVRITPDVTLFLTLSASYPTEAPPTYTLLAPALTKHQKQVVTQAFEDIYVDNIGDAVLFQWIEKLKEIVFERRDPPTERAETPNVAVTAEETSSGFDFDFVHGPIIQDRKSTFQGHVCEVASEGDVRQATNCLLRNKKIAQATHNISAYRIEKSNGTFLQDFDDDGESHAGGRLLHLLQILNVKNLCVIVSRWYGGVHLGPDRFRHINNAARQTLRLAGHVD